MTNSSFFTRFSKATASVAGKPVTFILAVTIIIVWAVLGPIFGFSDTWQLVINTGTTIITFLMVFLIQNTQNRDSIAVQLKLDELIYALKQADNRFLDVEDLDEKELEARREKMVGLAEEAKAAGIDVDDVAAAKKEKEIVTPTSRFQTCFPHLSSSAPDARGQSPFPLSRVLAKPGCLRIIY